MTKRQLRVGSTHPSKSLRIFIAPRHNAALQKAEVGFVSVIPQEPHRAIQHVYIVPGAEATYQQKQPPKRLLLYGQTWTDLKLS